VVFLARPVAASRALPASIHPKQISPADGSLDRLHRVRSDCTVGPNQHPAFPKRHQFLI
jgi:hypothetical protein